MGAAGSQWAGGLGGPPARVSAPDYGIGASFAVGRLLLPVSALTPSAIMMGERFWGLDQVRIAQGQVLKWGE